MASEPKKERKKRRPYINQTINQTTLLKMLNTFFIDDFDEVLVGIAQIIYFQQDGCPAYSTNAVVV